MFGFICEPCKTAGDVSPLTNHGAVIVKAHFHKNCKGGTWCDCQHRVNHKSVVIVNAD